MRSIPWFSPLSSRRLRRPERLAIALGGEASILAKLESQGVDLGLWGTSSRFGEGSPPVFLFEVAGATLGPDASTGIVNGESGLTLQRPQPNQDLLLLTPTVQLGPAGVLSASLSTLSGADLATGTIATLDASTATTRIRFGSRLELTDVRRSPPSSSPTGSTQPSPRPPLSSPAKRWAR